MAMKQIAKLLGVSLGSVHLWTKDIELTNEQKVQIKKDADPRRAAALSMARKGKPLNLTPEQKYERARRASAALTIKRDRRCLAENTLPKFSGTTRGFLIRTRGYRCEICGIKEWRGEPVPLVLDHIDGDSDNHVPDNVRMVCRNCDGLLPTYNGRNMGKGRSKSRMGYKWNTMGQHKREENGAPGESRTPK